MRADSALCCVTGDEPPISSSTSAWRLPASPRSSASLRWRIRAPRAPAVDEDTAAVARRSPFPGANYGAGDQTFGRAAGCRTQLGEQLGGRAAVCTFREGLGRGIRQGGAARLLAVVLVHMCLHHPST